MQALFNKYFVFDLVCFPFQLMLNDSDLQKAAEEMLNDAHDEVRKFSANYVFTGKV